MKEQRHTFEELRGVIAKLRDPDTGCPWDKEQTHESLKPFLLEEAYEVLDAIDQQPGELCDELGDVLLQVLLHSQIASERDDFSMDDVISGLAEKLIRRHPHVFGDEELHSSGEVITRWEELKKEEKSERKGVLDGIPKSMPALARSDKIGRRVSRVGFDWDDAAGVLEKVTEELEELKEAIASGETPHVEEELGDFLFTAAQLARILGQQAEISLQRANQKFARRFAELEARTDGMLQEMTLEEMHVVWDQVKASEEPPPS
jgi:tetrapyrrole methylase family protein/MazG family protein